MAVICRNIKQSSSAGFTLIELLVVIAIFAVVATVLLFQYSNFNTTVAVTDLAEEIGLSVRQAQTYATSVRSVDGGGGALSNTFPAYGIAFSTSASASQLYNPTDNSFILFVDTSSSPTDDTQTNNQYDNDGTCGNPAVGQECLQTFAINASDTIISLGAVGENGGSSTVDVPNADVVFHRPNPDAVICIPDGLGNCTLASGLVVTVQSPKGVDRTVTIWNTGQISVN
jgi:prepilin-type N-terminal cleavage/methylation domain-containing protein